MRDSALFRAMPNALRAAFLSSKSAAKLGRTDQFVSPLPPIALPPQRRSGSSAGSSRLHEKRWEMRQLLRKRRRCPPAPPRPLLPQRRSGRSAGRAAARKAIKDVARRRAAAKASAPRRTAASVANPAAKKRRISAAGRQAMPRREGGRLLSRRLRRRERRRAEAA